MKVREVAGYLNVNEKTVYRLAQRRELPGVGGERARAWVQGLEQACLQHPYQWFNFYEICQVTSG